ncbi:MAG: DivIVA domain-containing protein [Anaerostipes sp.]|jgi:cell division initiation protein|nr:DivIVA domain-containing protein [Anaerostipes sp.]MDD3744988.1 DivIVA domain-containing protein [Anaerostipes sp.]
MITPIELLGKDLKRGFGYKALPVDEFIEEVAKDYEVIYNENRELKEKTAALTENLNHYRSMEESLKRALIMAEETSRETMENAETAAKNITEQAKRDAQRIGFEAEENLKETQKDRLEEIHQMELKIQKLTGDYVSYKTKMKQLLKSQLEMLDIDMEIEEV